VQRLIATATTAVVPLVGTASAGAAGASTSHGVRAACSGTSHLNRHAARHLVLRAAVRVSADTIGIQPSVLVAALRSGKSTADVATAYGVDPQTVVDALVAAANDRIDTAVANGRLGAQCAAYLREHAPRLAERLVAAVPHSGGGSHGHGSHHATIRRRIIVGAARVAAQTIGVTPSDLADAYRAGRSVADVATANGVDPQTVVDALVAAANDRIDTAVANGKLSAEQATRLRARVPGLSERFVNAHRAGRS